MSSASLCSNGIPWRVLPLETAAGVRLDVIFGMLPFEQAAIARSVSRTGAGKPIRFCMAEALILYKIISEREQNLRDVRGLLRRRGAALDQAYLDPRVQELAEAPEQPDICPTTSAGSKSNRISMAAAYSGSRTDTLTLE